MYKCDYCGSVFEEDNAVDKALDFHPYGESYAIEYGNSCPECGSTDLSEAFQCGKCGEWFPVDERYWHPIDDMPLCESCLEFIEKDIESSPYHGCDDVFSMLDSMIGVS